ncbi:T9SS type A sorting domain-containing protein [Flavobacterium amniphilum]|nr:T9SS type A sorting domain-containing protein [Flavobacterium amniphilum]MCL9807598.1 T9SS type A sorting domain-containing protein [Flavobacterium amniphilum]
MKNNSGVELILTSKELADFVRIYDLKGRLIRSFINPTQNRMNLEEFTEGIYIVRVGVKDKQYIRKIKL